MNIRRTISIPPTMTTMAAALAGLNQLSLESAPPKTAERVVVRDLQTSEAGFTFVTHRIRTALNNSAGDCRLNYAIDYVEDCKPTIDKVTKVKSEAKPIADPAVKTLIENANARYQKWLKEVHFVDDKATYEKEMKKWQEAKNLDGTPAVEQTKVVKIKGRGNAERTVVFKEITKKNKKGVVSTTIMRRPNYVENPLKTDDYYDYALRILKRERVRFSKDSYYAVTVFVDMLVRQIISATFEVVKAQNGNNLTVDHFLAGCAAHGEALVPLLPLFRNFPAFRNPASVPTQEGRHYFEHCTRAVWDDVKFVNRTVPEKKYTIASKFVDFVNAIVDQFISRFGMAIRRSLFQGTSEIQHRMVDKPMILKSLGIVLNYEGISEEQVFDHINTCIRRYTGEPEVHDETGQLVSPKVLGYLGHRSEQRKKARDEKKAKNLTPAPAPAPAPASTPVMPVVGLPAMPVIPIQGH